jgi:pimeloyl-ACP methyl ester carboxylesterase
MIRFRRLSIVALAVTPLVAFGQFSPAPEGGPPTRTTFVRLSNNANAILVEPLTLNEKSRIAVLVTHPEHLNNFNYFIARGLPGYGYRVMALNYYGAEQTYYEFLQPIAAAIKALRAVPGVEKVVLAGHSTGGPELSSYQDVAENGPKACQGPERVYKCDGKGLDNLPKADGMILLDANAGAPERTVSIDPSVDWRHPKQRNAALDLFDLKNGYNPSTHGATYKPEFLSKFFAAQQTRANEIIDAAAARLAKIEKGEGEFLDDEPFVVGGSSLFMNGARPELADTHLLGKTHGRHMLLKADGTRPVQIVPLLMTPAGHHEDSDKLFQTAISGTVRHYLSFQALRLKPDYRMTEDHIYGIEWRSTPNSIQGNLQGIRVPTLVMSATCAAHVVFLETAFDLSAAKDKEFVGVEGATHGFTPCRPDYGDTFKRAFDYVDNWLAKPGRL